MSVTAMLAKLKQITREQQTYGTEQLARAGIGYDDRTIQGVNEHIPSSSWVENIPTMHRNIFRGKSLGSSVTAAQLAAIEDGSFDDLYVGDYWTKPVTIDGTEKSVNWRIADMDTPLDDRHHLVIVPDEGLYTALFDSKSSYRGYYLSTALHTSGLDKARAAVNTAFPGIVLTHSETFPTSDTAITEQNVTVEIMDSIMITGNTLMQRDYWALSHKTTDSQFSLFRIAPKYKSTTSASDYWTRSNTNSNNQVIVYNTMCGMHYPTITTFYVRPYFLIGASEE